MEQTRKHFTHDALIATVRSSFLKSLNRIKISEKEPKTTFSDIDCIMGAMAMFTFKYSSLLQFDNDLKVSPALGNNLKNLFLLENCPSDTCMRERLDLIDYTVYRKAFAYIFATLQRAKLLNDFRFLEKYYLCSLDGTGIFSSKKVHCQNCCEKHHSDGSITYYHQMLMCALVHPDKKVVFPFAPEPIMKTDGAEKNDCERNAAKRWIADLRREHPHLNAVITADGLFANEPFIQILKDHDLHYILVCKEADHKYLTDWVLAADKYDKPSLDLVTTDGIKKHYVYMHNVPLNGSTTDCFVNVIRYTEEQDGKVRNWMFVTDLPVNLGNIGDLVKGGRSRWKIENETFNTLKNQGYNFEHNYGHGKRHLHTGLAYLMSIVFFVDQCLQLVNKFFQLALDRTGSKKKLWNLMLAVLYFFELSNMESLYSLITHPPPLAAPMI